MPGVIRRRPLDPRVFYEGRLRSQAWLEHQVITGADPFDGSGLWIAPVVHEGNQNSSPEEVDVIERIVNILLGADAKRLGIFGRVYYRIGGSR